MAVGLFSAFVPIPLQMLLAATLAIPVRANLPISVGLVWLTNPITMPPVFYCTYKLGAWILQVPPRSLPETMSLDWVTEQLSSLWQPLLLGSLVSGVVLAILAYFGTMIYWRWWIRHNWRKRQERRRQSGP